MGALSKIIVVVAILGIIGFALLAATDMFKENKENRGGYEPEHSGSLSEEKETCLYGEDDSGSCVDYTDTGSVVKTYEYILRGERGMINFELYPRLDDALSKRENVYTCTRGECPAQKEVDEILTKRMLDHEDQNIEINALAQKIFDEADTDDDRARIAISLVQKLDYDYDALAQATPNKYPYEALYQKRGVCGEKAILMAGLLREIGYGVALFQYRPERHMAVGLRCPKDYDHLDSGYCFVESTIPSIITDDEGDYAGAGKLKSRPQIIEIAEGKEFRGVYEEYQDALDWKELRRKSGQAVDKELYNRWKQIAKKYGIKIDAVD